MRPKLSRRDFLRLCLLSAASAGAGCSRGMLSPLPTPTALSAPLPSDRIRLLTGGDAWTWQKTVRAAVDKAVECRGLSVRVNASEFPAALSEAVDTRGRPVFSASVPLAEGENQLFAICKRPNGEEELSFMSIIQQRLRNMPKALIGISISDGLIALDATGSEPAEQDGSPIAEFSWSARGANPEELKAKGASGATDLSSAGSRPRIQVLPPSADGEYYVNLVVKDEAGRQDASTIYFVVTGGQPQIPDYDHEHPEWVEHAIVYGIVPRKFGEPAFQAITARLADLADLGITAIWLAPINVSPAGDYGYAVKDYFELRSEFGTKDDFRRLVQEAHARGIRVLMDFVPNHSSKEHPYFQDTLQNKQDSAYWDFYDRNENGEPTHYFDWSHLPNLNYGNPEVRRFMIEAFSYWVREFDVDGFRVDACWGVKQRYPDFWPIWRRELKRIKPDLMLLAEASARDPYYFDNGYDVAYDWTDQLGKWAWELVWTTHKNRLLAYNLDLALTNRPEGFHPDALIFRFLNNNDTGHRFISKYGEGMARVATALLLTLPGIPCVYTGDELGIDFHPYMDPLPLEWEEKVPGMREYHKRLIRLRKENTALQSRLWQRLEFQAMPQPVFGYVRSAAADEDPVLVLLNFSKDEVTLDFALPPEFQGVLAAGKLQDLLADEEIAAGRTGQLAITVPPFTARVLTRPS